MLSWTSPITLKIVGQLQKLIKEAQHQGQEFDVMEQEVVNLRSYINELHEDKERCIIEVKQIMLEQLQQRDQMLMAQNDMLKLHMADLQVRPELCNHRTQTHVGARSRSQCKT